MNKEKIQEFLKTAMVTKERKDGTNYEVFNEESNPELWKDIKEILFSKDFQIRDFYYSTLSEAFYNIAYHLDSADDFTSEEIYEYCEADIYTHDLLKWVSEDLNNVWYVDEALKQTGSTDFIQTLQYAQQEQKAEIYYMALAVYEYLKEEVA